MAPYKFEELNDPEPPEETPEFMEEMFKTYQYQGLTPEKIRDKAQAEQYRQWLAKQ